MVPQVQLACILQIINGALVSLMGLLLLVTGPVMSAIIRAGQRDRPMDDPEGQIMLTALPFLYVVMGFLVLLVGLLNILAGIRAMQFLGRILWAIALFANIVPVITCYCAPTSIGVMVFGLIVFFNADVAKAFELGAEGVSTEEIRQRFAGRRPRRRIDYDEED